MKEFIEKLIGRLEEKAIEHRETGFEMERKGFSNIADKQYAKQTTYLNAIEIVNQLAEEYINCSTDTSTNTSSGWIPCSERLPKDDEYVLCSLNENNPMIIHTIIIAQYNGENHWYNGTVVAWQPLPPAYVPKEGRE